MKCLYVLHLSHKDDLHLIWFNTRYIFILDNIVIEHGAKYDA